MSRLLQKNREQMYPKMVTKHIRERYTLDAEFALINNYNADPETYGADYAEYQAYRAECKARAREECGLS